MGVSACVSVRVCVCVCVSAHVGLLHFSLDVQALCVLLCGSIALRAGQHLGVYQ